MDEERKKQVAIFRFGVIHDFVSGVSLERGEQERLLREKCERKWVIPYSSRTRLTRSTILRWIKLYKESNNDLKSLYPPDRSDRGMSRGMDEETSLALIALREEFPRLAVPSLIEKMRERGLIAHGVDLSLSTVYRFLHQRNLMKFCQERPADRRKFEAEFPNDLWQSDSMHGPRVQWDTKMRKSYLLAFLDDHSRLVPHAQFYLSEGLKSYLDALEKALLRRGLPRKLYLDNGPAFRSKHLEYITASLGIALIHSSPYKPQGRGKIERFFRTIRSQFLSGFKGNSLEELNEALELWLNDVYHQREHSSTGQSPFARFTSHMQCIRPAPKQLRDYFRRAEIRRVAKDRTITLNGSLYEAPVTLIGKKVTVLYHDNDMEHVEVKWKNKSYGFLIPVDLNVNYRIRRDRSGTEIEISDSADRYQGGRLWSKEKEDTGDES